MIGRDFPTSTISSEISSISERERIVRESLGSQGVWVWEYHLGHTSPVITHATESILGSGTEAFDRFLQLIRPEDRFRIQFGIQKSLLLRRGFAFECLSLRQVGSSGSKIQIQGNYVPNSGGGMFRGIVQSVGTLRTSTKVIQDDRFRSLFQLSAVGIVYGNLQGEIIDLNEKFSLMTGYAKDSIVGSSVFRFTHPADHGLTNSELLRLGGKLGNQSFMEKRYVHKDGHTFWVQVTVSTFAASEDRPGYFLAIVQDIDERMKAQEAIRQSEINFRLLSESLPQIVWIQDVNGSVYYLNKQWVDYTGRSIEESLGRGWFDSIHPDDRPHIISVQGDSEVVHGGPSPWQDVVQRLKMRDGSYRWFLSRGVPVYAENGDIVRWLGTSTDIDAQKKIEKELDDARMIAISASESKSAFLANMSHEIRTPLGIILGYCELLKRPGISPEIQAEFLTSMTKNGKDLSILIDNILDLSKLEAEKMDVDLHPVHIREQLETIVKGLRIKAQEKGITIHLNIDYEVPSYIPTDEIRLRQILVNIVGNAIKFTDEGSIRLHAQKPPADEILIIDVADTGCGMEAHQTERLFKAFSQVDATSTRRHGGTGLGLMLSKLLAKALGGDVALAATEPNQGSVFRITISSRLSSFVLDDVRVKDVPAMEPNSLKDMRILLADDAVDNQFIFSTFLRAEGAEVDVADNGLDAVESGLKTHYDLILMDIQMPIMDGYDATRRLRAAGFAGPILALSAHALTEDSTKSKLAGCDDHIAKPVDFARLVSTIREYVKTSSIQN